jgi:hypothetical protein
MAESPKPEFRKVDPTRADPARPPPLPPSRGRAAGLVARARAWLAIARLRASERARRVGRWAKRRPVLAGGGALAVLAAAGLATAVAVEGVPELDLRLPGLAPATVAEASAAAKARPRDPAAQRELGHALWTAKRRKGALAAYGRALALDRGVADERLVANLVASFGGPGQAEAEALLWKNKLVGAQEPLERLVGARRYSVRWGAVRTLDRLDKGSRRNWETAYVADLQSPDCDVRRNAVEKLGAIGTARSLQALRAAEAEDEKTGGWLKRRCLGGRIDDARERIASRR